ncbi:MAG: alpha/beta hydrolase [Cyanobacteria bacterium P01_F01_bin.56]
MSQLPQALWLGINPSLKHFDQRLCRLLSRQVELHYWCYNQSLDEPCSIQSALTLLDDYLQSQSQPIHLIGHGLSGAVGLLYARLYAHRVKSLTLLSVGSHPAVSWHAHYYVLRNRLPCDRSMILMQMANMLFCCQSRSKLVGLAQLLEKVLDSELAPHSLVEHQPFSPGGVEVPLLVCRGAHDVIVDSSAHAHWQPFLKTGDRLWTCPEGRHFFQHTHVPQTSGVILDFWYQTASPLAETPLIEIFSP